MEKDFLKNNIRQQYLEVGSNLYNINNEFIMKEINDNDSFNIVPINLTDIIRGKFYFIFYDIQGKSSNMEKFNPVFIIDWLDDNNTRILYGVSTNFLPVSIATIFFNNIMNHNLDTLEHDKNKNTNLQSPIQNINFANIYKLLYSIGFEWAIRKFDCKKINNVREINMNILSQFITMSTHKMTGVDDGKLIEIWQSKIKQQEERHKKIIKDLLGDYNKIATELNSQIITLSKQEQNLEESYKMMKTFLK